MESFREQLAALVSEAGITLSGNELTRLEDYYALLERWNRKINLTALPLEGYPTATLRRLFLEPIVASRLVPEGLLAWTDVGSGGGSPAIPLKILRSRARLTMIESRERKAAFLREAIRSLDLRDTAVLTTRFEELKPTVLVPADLVTSRAVKADRAFWEGCQRILRPNGRLLLFVNATWQGGRAPSKGFQLVETVEIPGGDTVVLGFARVFHVEQR